MGFASQGSYVDHFPPCGKIWALLLFKTILTVYELSLIHISQAGDTITVLSGDVALDTADKVVVKNESTGNVVVNGTTVAVSYTHLVF